MEIPTRDRADLKSYFVKNAIPTESNFAELIDGMLNQYDDRLVKLPGDPLSIEAAGTEESEKKAIHFYQDFGDDHPAWVLSLSPNRDLARSGLNIGDGGGQSRLFIDRNTGNVGIGTTNPGDKLVVYDPSTSGDGGITIRRGHYARLSIISDNYWSGIELRRDSAGIAGRPHIDFTNDLTTNFGIRISAPTNDTLTIDGGNVGIGANTPSYPFHVTKASGGASWQARFTNGDSNVYLCHSGGYGIHINTGKENATNRYALEVRNKSQRHLYVRDDGYVGIGPSSPSYPLHVTKAFSGANWQARFTNGNSNVYLSHNGGYGIHINTGNENVANRYALQVRNKSRTHLYVRDDGRVGIGTASPGTSLEVNGTFRVKNGNNIFYYNGAADITLKYPPRGTGGRALVHGANNTLRLNYGNDFSGGVLYYGSFNKASSRTLKENVKDLSGEKASEMLETLAPLQFNLIGDQAQRVHLGFIAEDVPALIATPDRKAVTTDHIVAVLTRVVQDQQRTLSSLAQKMRAWEEGR
jgi:hypothetical protein